MKTKTFRLQTVLDFRAAALDEAEGKLRQSLQELEKARTRVAEARLEADQVAGAMCQIQGAQGALSAGVHQRNRQAYRAQVARIDEFQAAVDLRMQDVHASRERLVQAKKDHDILLRLREKWLQTTAQEEARREESLLNDLINARHFRLHHANTWELQTA